MLNSSNLTNITDPSCPSYDFGEATIKTRYYLIGVVMTTICAFGFLGNLVIIVILTRPRMRSASSWYLVALAIFDTLVMLCTILLYSVEVIYDWWRDYGLYRMWFAYVKIVYVISHISQVSTVYLTLAATCERWVSLWFPRKCKKLCGNKWPTFTWILVILLCVIALTITKYWELLYKFQHNHPYHAFDYFSMLKHKQSLVT